LKFFLFRFWILGQSLEGKTHKKTATNILVIAILRSVSDFGCLTVRLP
jgi:hypothetical protein